MQRLELWAHEIVRRNWVALGLDAQSTILLSTYLEAVHADGVAKAHAFAEMLDWWTER